MGAWGVGAFDNDAALNLLDELGDLEADERVEYLEEMFARAPLYPDGPIEMMFPDLIVTGAALAAIALPGGPPAAGLVEEDFPVEVEAAALPPPTREFAAAAVAALDVAVRPGAV